MCAGSGGLCSPLEVLWGSAGCDAVPSVTEEGCGELAAAIQHRWAVQPKVGFTIGRLSCKFFPWAAGCAQEPVSAAS